MTDLLLRLFVKHASDTSDPAVRAGYGRLAGVTGIVCNLLLFALKLLAGMISGSVSITADAVNNLSDASGSIVTSGSSWPPALPTTSIPTAMRAWNTCRAWPWRF